MKNVEKKEAKRSLYSKFEKKDFLFCYLLIAFPVIQFLIFWVYKNCNSFILAFQDGNGAFTLDNLKWVWKGFTDQDMFGFNLGSALGRSLIIWLVGTFLSTPISVITTYVLACKIRGHGVLRICYIIPSLIGTIIWTSLVRYMMAYDGPIIAVLKLLNVNLPANAIRNGLLGAKETAFPALLIFNFLLGIVGNNAVLTGAFSRVPEDLFEAARVDGAGYWRTCFSIAIPCVWSTITMTLIFGLCGIFTADCGSWLYSNGTGEPGLTTMGFMLFNLTYNISQNGGTAADYGYPAALGLVLTVTTLPVVIFGRKLLEKIQDAIEV